MGRPTRAFTLIELLIVIAIILILIAIALPNFLEAQVRAKVTKAAGDMRALGQAVESFRIDHSFLLIDMWDDNTPIGAEYLLTTPPFKDIADPSPNTRLMFDVMAPLTSPVQYIGEIPQDPLLHDPPKDFARSTNWISRTDTYTYFDRDPRIPDTRWTDDHNLAFFWPNYHTYGDYRLSDGEFGFMGSGPDYKVNQSQSRETPRGMPYSPTNGTKSNGQLIWRSGMSSMMK